MKALRKAARVLYGLFAAIGLVTVLVMTTPVVFWWAHAYAGPIRQPQGEVLILLSAASDDQAAGRGFSIF